MVPPTLARVCRAKARAQMRLVIQEQKAHENEAWPGAGLYGLMGISFFSFKTTLTRVCRAKARARRRLVIQGRKADEKQSLAWSRA